MSKQGSEREKVSRYKHGIETCSTSEHGAAFVLAAKRGNAALVVKRKGGPASGPPKKLNDPLRAKWENCSNSSYSPNTP